MSRVCQAYFLIVTLSLLSWQIEADERASAPALILPVGCSVTRTCRVLSLKAPQAYQVFQRDATNSAHLMVRASTSGLGSSIRMVATDINNRFITESRSAAALNFTGQLKVPSGGWYKIWLQEIAADGKTIRAEGVIDHVGVGEVFLIAGQSNSIMSGESPQINSNLTSGASLSGSQLQTLRWRQVIDNNGSRGSPWPMFVNLMSRQLGMPVAVIPVGCGGTTASQWLPADVTGANSATSCGPDARNPGALYSRLVRAASQIGNFRAVLWHQGESDTIQGTSTQTYFDQMVHIISRLNSDLGRRVPWIVANASYFPGYEINFNTCALTGSPYTAAPAMLAVRAAQQRLWQNELALPGPDTDGLIGTRFRYAPSPGGCIHFSNNGLKVHGQLWYRTVSETGLIPGAEAAPLTGLVSIQKWTSPYLDYLFSPNRNPIAGYTNHGQAFRLNSQNSSNHVPLYQCTYVSGAHFLSLDSNCESFARHSTLGWISTFAGKVGTRPLYRFAWTSGIVSIMSTNQLDEPLRLGYVPQGLQGYSYY